MRILAVNTFMTLDGVMQAPGGPDEDPTGGFTHGGWAVNYFDDEMMEQMAESEALRAAARPRHLRDLRGPLAIRRGPDRRPPERHPQVRRVEDAEARWNGTTPP